MHAFEISICAIYGYVDSFSSSSSSTKVSSEPIGGTFSKEENFYFFTFSPSRKWETDGRTDEKLFGGAAKKAKAPLLLLRLLLLVHPLPLPLLLLGSVCAVQKGRRRGIPFPLSPSSSRILAGELLLPDSTTQQTKRTGFLVSTNVQFGESPSSVDVHAVGGGGGAKEQKAPPFSTLSLPRFFLPSLLTFWPLLLFLPPLSLLPFASPLPKKRRRKKEQQKEFVWGGGKKSHPREKMKKSLFCTVCVPFTGKKVKLASLFFVGEGGFPRNYEKPPRLDASLAFLEAIRNCPRGLTLLLCKMGQHPPPPDAV